MAGPVPNQTLMSSSQHPNTASSIAIASDLAMVMAIGAHQISQHLRVANI